jgi:uncharacterized protein YlbG (UPF0298 family)
MLLIIKNLKGEYVMKLSRECYIITYKQNKAYKSISQIKGLEIYYSSKKQKYITAYFDTADKERILKELKEIKGITEFGPTRLDQAEMDINL